MSERLPTDILVAALLRRTNDAGGLGVVRTRGDARAGTILILATDRDKTMLLERGIGPDGRPALLESTLPDDTEGYWHRRRRLDPDLWIIELDIPNVQRLVAETILDD